MVQRGVFPEKHTVSKPSTKLAKAGHDTWAVVSGLVASGVRRER